jgi:Na+/melibiose symporter-like transporter
MNFTIGGVLFIIPVYVQSELGANPLTTGLTLIPMSVAIFVMSSMAGKLSKIIQPRYILAMGALAAIGGSVYLTLIFNPYTTIIDMVPGIFMLGVGMGIVFPHTANEIFFAARKEQQPDASGIMNTGINLGSSLGTAILGLILILGGFSSVGLATNTGQSTGVQDNILGVHELVGKFEHQSYPTEKNMPVDIQKVNTMKTAFNLITIVLLVSLIISLFIPRHKTKKELDGCVSSNI